LNSEIVKWEKKLHLLYRAKERIPLKQSAKGVNETKELYSIETSSSSSSYLAEKVT
jgi:hypothetical protein